VLSQDWANTVIATLAPTNQSSILLSSASMIPGLDLTGDILVFGGLWYTSSMEQRHHSGNHEVRRAYDDVHYHNPYDLARHVMCCFSVYCNKLGPFVGYEAPGQNSLLLAGEVACEMYSLPWNSELRVCGRCRAISVV
jgi:hypothetical protein